MYLACPLRINMIRLAFRVLFGANQQTYLDQTDYLLIREGHMLGQPYWIQSLRITPGKIQYFQFSMKLLMYTRS